MVTKSEIIGQTLDQLIDIFHKKPDSFQYVGDESADSNRLRIYHDNIIWQTLIRADGKLIDDPNEPPKTIVVTFSKLESNISICAYNRTFTNIQEINIAKADAYIESTKTFKRFRKNYKKFKKIRNLILRHSESRKANDFFYQMSKVFPVMLDKHILGK